MVGHSTLSPAHWDDIRPYYNPGKEQFPYRVSSVTLSVTASRGCTSDL